MSDQTGPDFSTFSSAGEAAGEPVGWNVYHGNGGDWTFREFVPNEHALAAEAGKMAAEVERHLEDGVL